MFRKVVQVKPSIHINLFGLLGCYCFFFLFFFFCFFFLFFFLWGGGLMTVRQKSHKIEATFRHNYTPNNISILQYVFIFSRLKDGLK